jgi:hypothetical protein
MWGDSKITNYKEKENYKQKIIFTKGSSRAIRKRVLDSTLIKKKNLNISANLVTIFLSAREELPTKIQLSLADSLMDSKTGKEQYTYQLVRLFKSTLKT